MIIIQQLQGKATYLRVVAQQLLGLSQVGKRDRYITRLRKFDVVHHTERTRVVSRRARPRAHWMGEWGHT
jgi:hypothetical protein